MPTIAVAVYPAATLPAIAGVMAAISAAVLLPNTLSVAMESAAKLETLWL